VAEAESQAECERLRDAYVADLRAAGQASAAETVLRDSRGPDGKAVVASPRGPRDWADFVTCYRYPKEHWVHLRTSNPIESIFSGVRLRTNASKRMRQRETALYLVFKIVERLGQNWRALNGGENLMALVLEGYIFHDGIRERKPAPQAAASAG